MNERIKELMTKASDVRVSGFGETEILNPEKFAELIIKECTSYMKQSNAFTYANQADDCAQRMLKHFGIKE